MNKKGISDIYMLIIQIIAVGLIFSLLMFKAQDIDMDAIHRNLVAKDVGLTLNTISFLPTNIKYTYLTEDNGNWVLWDTFYVELGKNSVAYYAEPPSISQSLIKPGQYTFVSNKLEKYEGKIDTGVLVIKENSFNIQKTDTIKATTEDPILEKLICKSTKLKYEFKPLKYCDEFKEDGESLQFRDIDGNKMPNEEKDFTIKYDGFEKRYFLGKKKYFKCKGLMHKENYEIEIINKIIENINQEESENKIYLTLNNESTNKIVVRIPKKDFEKHYNIGCNIINKLLETDIEINGTTIIPTREDKIIIELGTIKNEIDTSKISEALNNG